MVTDTVPPLIAAQLNYLVAQSPFTVKIEQMWSGGKTPGLLDRFTLSIPFCLDSIRWDVMYNAMYPLTGPDILFGPEDVNFRPYNKTKDSNSSKNALSNWNNKDPTRLLTLILELRGLFMEYQKKRVGEINDERLQFEMSTMLAREGIEMFISSVNDKSEEVKFAVPLLDMDLNKMVIGSTWRHQKIYLQVIYPVNKKFSSNPSAPRLKLFSSPELKALFSTDDFRLPSWVDGMCIAGYLPDLEEMLGAEIRAAIANIEVRRRFIVALCSHFGRPLEADPVFCRKATFLACSGTFTFMVHFSLPLHFPKQKPQLMFQSSQHFNANGLPMKSHVLMEYPWSPRWETLEMAERLSNFVIDECLSFKKYCSESSLQQQY